MNHCAYFDSKIEELGREMLQDVYDKLSESEKKKFMLIFKSDAEKIKFEHVRNAYRLCANAVNKRKEKSDG